MKDEVRKKFPESLAGADISDVDLDEEEIYVNGERLTDERVEQMAAESVRLARARDARAARRSDGR